MAVSVFLQRRTFQGASTETVSAWDQATSPPSPSYLTLKVYCSFS